MSPVSALRRPPAPQSIIGGHIPAPVRGIDSISPASAIPEGFCTRAYNLIAAEFGLRARLGYQEVANTITGHLTSEIRTMIPFTGSVIGKDKLFCATSQGIWNATTTPGVNVLGFAPSASDTAGYGIATQMVTPAGHFHVYTDEVNGLHVYTESTDTWAQVKSGATVAWTINTVYQVGDLVTNDTGPVKAYKCVTPGTSAGAGGPTGTGSGIGDNTAVWDYSATYTTLIAHTIGTSLADQHAGLTCDTTKLVFACVFKNRIWFVERDSARAWYLPIGSIYGTATSFELGNKFRSGGFLVGFWDWTMDGGAGPDDYLVALSSGGDVVIYKGTDPSSAATFGLVGVWTAGALPYGRRIATPFGGDLLILCKLGLLSLSTLVSGKQMADRSQYATAPISNLFTSYMLSASGYKNWSIHIQPEDSALIVTVPVGVGLPTNQIVMSLTTKGWTEYRDLPIFSGCVWQGKFYFGTIDGRVMVNTGYLDAVYLATPATYSAVQWRLLTSFQNFGTGRFKQAQIIRPTILCEGGVAPYTAEARYKYDMREISTVAVASTSGWDFAKWDSALWDNGAGATQAPTGAVGMGVDMAIALRGAATSSTTLVGIDVMYTQGGLL